MENEAQKIENMFDKAKRKARKKPDSPQNNARFLRVLLLTRQSEQMDKWQKLRMETLVKREMKDYEDARRLARRLIRLGKKKDPVHHYVALLVMGKIYYQMRQYKRALGWQKKAATIRPDNSFAYEDQARSYLNLRENEKALENINRALSLACSNFHDLYCLKAQALMYLGRFAEAEDNFQISLQCKPDWPRSLRYYRELKRKMKKKKQ